MNDQRRMLIEVHQDPKRGCIQNQALTDAVEHSRARTMNYDTFNQIIDFENEGR